MRTYLTIGFTRKPGNPVVLVGPEKDKGAHSEFVKKLQEKPAHADLSEVQMWGGSEGVLKRQKLMTIQAYEAEQKSRAEAKAKAKAEQEAKAKDEAGKKK